MMTETLNPLKNAQIQIKEACDKLSCNPAVYQILANPMRVVEINIPIKMDNGTVRVFTGFRSMHNNALGPGKGGIRFHPDVNIEEVKALSAWMTIKCSIAGLPYGGGKGGIIVDPLTLSQGELQRLSRGYIRAMHKVLGEKLDIPAPDVGTDGQIMCWMIDEYNKLAGHSAIGMITGKPVEFGGSKGRLAATGLGIAISTRELLKRLNINLEKSTALLQGFGNVGSYAGLFLQKYGVKIMAIMEYDPTKKETFVISNDDGIDIAALNQYKTQNKGAIRGFGGTKEISVAEFWSKKADILLPCALENAITVDVANTINVKVIAEGANGPVTKEADDILYSKGITIIPDVLANAGGVTVSYFEWVQNLYTHYWLEEEVSNKQEVAMCAAFDAVYEVKEEHNCSFRTAAYLYAIKRIAEVMKLRGWY